MHNPNNRVEEPMSEDPHDPRKLDVYLKEDPKMPGDPDENVIKAMEEEEISEHRARRSDDANVEESKEKVAHPVQNPKPKKLSSRKKKYWLLALLVLILVIVLFVVLLFFRNYVFGTYYQQTADHNTTLAHHEELVNATNPTPTKAIILTNDTDLV